MIHNDVCDYFVRISRSKCHKYANAAITNGAGYQSKFRVQTILHRLVIWRQKYKKKKMRYLISILCTSTEHIRKSLPQLSFLVGYFQENLFAFNFIICLGTPTISFDLNFLNLLRVYVHLILVEFASLIILSFL